MRFRPAAVLLGLGLFGLGFYFLVHGLTAPADVLQRLIVGVALVCISVGAVWLAAELFGK